MAMTVRPGDDDERAEEVDILAVSQEGLVRYAGLLERLGTVRTSAP